MTDIKDGVVDIHGYVPGAPFEKFRHVHFSISLELQNSVLLSK